MKMVSETTETAIEKQMYVYGVISVSDFFFSSSEPSRDLEPKRLLAFKNVLRDCMFPRVKTED